MAVYDNSYSRFIALAKVILPLAALALLSTLFLLGRQREAVSTIPYADIDVAKVVKEQVVRAPAYASVTEDGTAISITATTASPDQSAKGAANAENVRASLDFGGGRSAQVTSDTARIDTVTSVAALTGQVLIETSDGYRIETPSLTTSLNRTDVTADQGITAEGPIGTLEAGHMSLSATDKAGTNVLVFKDGVKLIYQPTN